MNVLDHLRRPGWPRRALFSLGLLLLLAIAVRILLDPIAARFTRKGLNESEAVSGDFQSVHVTLFPPSYDIRRLKIIEARGGDGRHPLFYVERAGVVLDWRRLLHGEMVARLRLDEPKIVFTRRPIRIPHMGTAFGKMILARVDRAEVREGEILLRELAAPHQPEIWVHHIDLTAENLATREELARGRPATVSAHGTLGHSGALSFSASADRFAAKLAFTGDLAIRGWKADELYELEETRAKLQTPKGTVDLFAEFKARGGAISGRVRSVLKNVDVRPTEEGFGDAFKAWVADRRLRLVSNPIPGGNAVGTVVSIEGRLDEPDVRLWPTVLRVVRNALVEGISAGFARRPPTASEKEGVLTQTTHVPPKYEGPPKAQLPKTEPGSGKK